MLTTEVLLSLGQGHLDLSTSRAIVQLAGTQIRSPDEANDLGFLCAKGLGYDVASDLCPWPTGPLAHAFACGIVEHEISTDIDLDDISYEDITDTTSTKAVALDMLLASSALCFLGVTVAMLPF